MSSYSPEESELYNDIYYNEEIESYKNVDELKENLLPYNIKEPIFFNYYKYIATENEEKNSKSGKEKNIEIDKNIVDLEKKEQIDEIKVKLFLILYLECDYDNNLYKDLISNNYIKTKRLIIQHYNTTNNRISFDKKNYCFIPQYIKGQNGIIFNYNGQDFEVKHENKKYILLSKDNEIISENEFGKINNIINLYEERNNYKKAKSQKKSKKNNKSDINNNTLNNSDNKSNIGSNFKNENKALSQNTPKENEGFSKISDTSDNEINGEIFFDKNNRYIFKSDYSKEIDGIFTQHKAIKLNKGFELELLKSLDYLKEGQYDNNNDIQCHIIYKNFEDNEISENIPFFLEVKKSMVELNGLLIQIKEISKVVNNISIDLPKYLIGIICKYEDKQISFQKNELAKAYKENGNITFFKLYSIKNK